MKRLCVFLLYCACVWVYLCEQLFKESADQCSYLVPIQQVKLSFRVSVVINYSVGITIKGATTLTWVYLDTCAERGGLCCVLCSSPGGPLWNELPIPDLVERHSSKVQQLFSVYSCTAHIKGSVFYLLPIGGFCCTLTKSAPHWWLSFPLLPSLKREICSSLFRWLSISRTFSAPMPFAPSTDRCFWSSVQLDAYHGRQDGGKGERKVNGLKEKNTHTLPRIHSNYTWTWRKSQVHMTQSCFLTFFMSWMKAWHSLL